MQWLSEELDQMHPMPVGLSVVEDRWLPRS